MTMTFQVISGTNPIAIEYVQGSGHYSVAAEQSAIAVAKAVKKIPNPVVIKDDHRCAMIVRQMVERMVHNMMRSARLTGSSPMCFDKKYYLDCN